MGPDHPENTSKPRICLPKPSETGAKPTKAGAKPAQTGVLTDRNRPLLSAILTNADMDGATGLGTDKGLVD